MTHRGREDCFDLAQALEDPAGYFGGDPWRVTAAPGLGRGIKLELLRRWEHDSRELAVAEDENMAGGENARLGEVRRAIESLDGDSASGTPTKQG